MIDQFAYPRGGTGIVYERMCSFVKKQGGNIFLSTPVKRILTSNYAAYAVELENGAIVHYDHIISMMPFSVLVNRLPDVPDEIKYKASQLKFRNTIILNIQSANLFPDNWIYIHSDDLKMSRLTNFRNWVPQLYGLEKVPFVPWNIGVMLRMIFGNGMMQTLLNLVKRN